MQAGRNQTLFKTILLKNKIFLAQTDTTVGFVTQDSNKLSIIKQRDPKKPFLKVYATNSALKKDFSHLPSKHKNRIRRQKSTTFIVKNSAFRVSKSTQHNSFLKKISWGYSSSANEASKHYDFNFASTSCDIIVSDNRGLYEATASQLLKLSNTKIRRLR